MQMAGKGRQEDALGGQFGGQEVAVVLRVVRYEDHITEPSQHVSHDLVEGRSRRDVVLADPVDVRGADVAPRVHEGRELVDNRPIRCQAEDRDLDYLVSNQGREARRLDIDNREQGIVVQDGGVRCHAARMVRVVGIPCTIASSGAARRMVAPPWSACGEHGPPRICRSTATTAATRCPCPTMMKARLRPSLR